MDSQPKEGQERDKETTGKWKDPAQHVDWQDDPLIGVGIEANELYERAGEADIMAAAGKIGSSENRRYSRPEGFRLFWKPVPLMLGAGVPGVLLMLLAFYLRRILVAGGLSLKSGMTDYTGLVMLALIFSGGLLLMIAAPVYRPTEWTPQWQARVESDRDHFAKIRLRERD